MFFLINFINSILWLLIWIIIVLDLFWNEYPFKSQINKILSWINVPFQEQYKIVLLFLIPLWISLIMWILEQII